MKCPNCHLEVAEGSRFCQSCGSPLLSITENAGDVVAVGGSTVVKAGTVYMGNVPGASTAQECPICGRHNQAENTFRCRRCNRPNICLSHQDPQAYICSDCRDEEIRLKADREAETKAQVDAAIKARVDQELQRQNEMYERLKDRCSIKMDDHRIMSFMPVPAGEFLMGSNAVDAKEDEKPEHLVYLDEYLIGWTPVTVEEFSIFVAATGYKTKAEKLGRGLVYLDGKGDDVFGASWQHPYGPQSDIKFGHPVTLVSWLDADQFCRWFSETYHVSAHLPSEAEWEKAARGIDGRIYPWGNEPPDDTRCNFGNQIGDTSPVINYLDGMSFYGCREMAGNVDEWTNSKWGREHLDHATGDWSFTLTYPYPYRAEDGREDVEQASGVRYVTRGGDWFHKADCLRVTRRGHCGPSESWNFKGFRICLSLEKKS